MENTQQLDKYVLLIFFSTSNDKEIPSQFHQVTPASWMLMRYSKSRRIFSVMICLKRMDVWWVETHEYDLKTSCSKALKAFNRLYFAMSSLRQTNSMKPGFFRNIYIYITFLPSSSILTPTPFTTRFVAKGLEDRFFQGPEFSCITGDLSANSCEMETSLGQRNMYS